MPRVTIRERAAFHEAGHVVGWLSAPSPPVVVAVTIEPDRSRGFTGEVRHRGGDPRSLRLAVGRALARGHLRALAPAIAEVAAHVRAHAAGPVAEALRLATRLPAVEDGEWDYWSAYELSASVGLTPEATWRREVRRARRFLRRHWDEVEHVAGLLLRQPTGRRRLTGAPLRTLLRGVRRRVRAVDPARYEDAARELLAVHRARWAQPHWVVLERISPRRVAVGWAEDRSTAQALAAELGGHYDVERRRGRAVRRGRVSR